MKPIQINDSLIAIQVPKNAERFKIFNDIGRPYVSYFIGVDTFRLYIDYQSEIIGLVQTPELTFDFDAFEFVDNKDIDDIMMLDITITKFKDYHKGNYPFFTSNDSFRSRIEKAVLDAGMYLVNPIQLLNGKNISCSEDAEAYNENSIAHHESESKLLKNNLLIIQKI